MCTRSESSVAETLCVMATLEEKDQAVQKARGGAIVLWPLEAAR